MRLMQGSGDQQQPGVLAQDRAAGPLLWQGSEGQETHAPSMGRDRVTAPVTGAWQPLGLMRPQGCIKHNSGWSVT